MKKTIKSLLALAAIIMCGGAWALDNATVSAGFDAGNTDASSVFGGTAFSSSKEWNANSATYTESRGSSSNKAMTITATGTHIPYMSLPSSMSDNTDWTINISAKLPTFSVSSPNDRLVIFGVSGAAWGDNKDGIGLVYTAANKIALEKFHKNGGNNTYNYTRTVLIDEITIDDITSDYHCFTVTFNASATGTAESPYFTLYVDGVKKGDSGTNSRPTGYVSSNINNHALCIGNYYGGAVQVRAAVTTNMLIDDVAVWATSCLSATDVKFVALAAETYGDNGQPVDGIYSYKPIVGSAYEFTGWKVSNIDDLANWNFAAEMVGASMNNRPVAARGFNAVKNNDGTVKVEFQTSNTQTKCVSVLFKVDDEGYVYAIAKGACCFTRGDGATCKMCNDDGSPLNPGSTTISVNVATSVDGDGYGVQAIAATPRYMMSNALGERSVANYSNRTYTFALPTAPGVAASDIIAVKKVGLVTEGNNDLPAKIKIGNTVSTSRVGPTQEARVVDGTTIGKVVNYSFETPVRLYVGQSVPFTFLDPNDTDVTAAQKRFRSAKVTGDTGRKISAMTIVGENTWAPICDVIGDIAEPIAASATISGDTKWSEIGWTTGDFSADKFELTLEGDAKLTFDEVVECYSLSVNGNGSVAIDESFFVDGCYIKTVVGAHMSVSIADTVTLDQTMKTGFVGALSKSDKTIDLRAQNKEVISINIAGGSISGQGSYDKQDSPSTHLVPKDDNYYGLAPVKGRDWNNINGKWKNKSQTVTLKGAKATDGSSSVTRDTMDLSATASTTWEANITNSFLRGYLDDGEGVTVSVTGIPYKSYDVIVYVTSDNSGYRLAPVTINGTKYTYINGEVVVDSGSTDWGEPLQNVPAFGKNAMIIRNQSRQDLTIYSTRNSGAGRGTVCAVQVINMGDEVITRRTYETTIESSVTEATLENLTYTGSGSTLVSGELTQVTLNVNGEATDAELTLTISPETKMEFLKIVGARPVKIVASAALDAISLIDLTETTGNVTLAQSAKKVTVGEHARAILADGVTVTDLTNNGGTIRRETDYSSGISFRNGDGTYEFKNALIKGTNGNGYIIKVLEEDVVKFANDAWNDLRTCASLNVSGGEVTLGKDSGNGAIWYGGDGSTFTQTGGTVTSTANGTDTSGSGSGLLLGYTGSGISSMSISGGQFQVLNSSLNFYGCSALTVSGSGHVKAKGVFQGSGTTTITVSENGIFELGSIGWTGVALAMNGGIFKAYETTSMAGAMTIGGAVTIDVAAGQTLTISGAITGSSNITKTGEGMLKITSDMSGYTGQITAQGGLVDASDNSKVVTDGGAILVEESLSAYAQGNWTVPSGLENKTVMVRRPTGDVIDSSVVLADRTVKISGVATSIDVTYTNRMAFAQRYKNSGTCRSNNNNNPTYNNQLADKTTGVLLKYRPWIQDIDQTFFTGTKQLTLATAGMMSKEDDTLFLHMGSSANAGNYGLYLATGKSDDEVIVGYNVGRGTTNLISKITVPNARTARHTYVITKDDDVVSSPTKSTFTIYLDGEKWETFVVTPRFEITGGFQVGSDFGGYIHENNLVNAVPDDDEDEISYVNFIRVYNRIISEAEIRKYSDSTEYPYNSPNGTYQRDFTTGAGQNWKGDNGAWTSSVEAEHETGVAVPVKGLVVANFVGDATINVNQSETTSYEKLSINGPAQGSATVTFTCGDGATAIKSVATTINTPVILGEGSIDLTGGPTKLGEHGSITFDFTSLTAQQIVNEGDLTLKVTGVTDKDIDMTKLSVRKNEAEARLVITLSRNADDECIYATATITSVYLKYASSAHSYTFADGTTATPLEHDIIHIDQDKYSTNANDIWHVGEYANLPDGIAAHTLSLDSSMNFKKPFADNQKVKIASGVSVYHYGNIGANVTISGDGTLFPGFVTDGATIGDGVEISCPVVISANELSKGVVIDGAVKISGTISFAESATSVFKLNKNGTLTVATALAEGKVIGSNAAYVIEKTNNDNGTVTYSVAILATVTVGEETTNYVTLEEAFTAAKENSVPVTIVHTIPGDLTIQEGVTTVNVGNYAIDGAITIPEGSVLTVSATTDSYETHGISGLGKIIVNSGTVNAKNKSGGYAVEDTTVQIDGGTFKLILGTDGAYTGAAGDPTINNAKFVIGSEGALTNNGWVNIVGSMTLSAASEKTVFSGSNFRGAPTVTKSGDGAIMFNLSNANGKAEHKFTSLTLNAGSLTVKSAVAVDSPTSGVDGKVVNKTSGADDTIVYSLVDATPDTPITPEEGEIVVPVVPDAGIAVEPGADVKVPTNTDVSKIEVVYNGVELSKAVEGESGHPKYVEVSINETTGAVELTTTDSAKPAATAIAMATPTVEEEDQVQFTITNPIPGLFYAVSSCDEPDGDFTSATGDQATTAASKTVSIPMEFTDGKKVKYYKVSVKATR